MQQDAAACEKAHKFPDAVIAHLQAGRQEEAVNVTKESFEKCGKLSKNCAAEEAPVVVQELRFGGVALSDKCKAAVRKAQTDKATMKEVRKCENDAKVPEKLLSELNNGDLNMAVASAREGLEKCMKLSDECSFQVAPVLVNQVVTMAMMQAGGMMPVLVQASLEAAEQSKKVKTSLLKIAMEDRRQRLVHKKNGATVMLQRSVYHVNRLILQLAREQM